MRVIFQKILFTVIIPTLLSAPVLAEEKQSPLANHPSAPGAHLSRIEALGNNAWLNLGRPAPDPRYGPALGRSWSRKMAFAPDLRGAFLYGEGVHGGSAMRGGQRHYNDDLYFYDINAHAWICCHPGTPLDDPGLSYDDDLLCEVDRNGNPIPVAVSVHGYWTPAYNTHAKKFTMVPAPASMYWRKALLKHRPWFAAADKDQRKPDPRWGGYGSPWNWNPRTGLWEFHRVNGPAPRHKVDNAFFYSRKLKKGVNLFRGVWLYDYAKKQWQKVNQQGGGNGAYCYDHRREWIYVVKARRDESQLNFLLIYDILNNQWRNPRAEGDAGHGAEANRNFFTCDTANDVAVLHIHNRHHIYNPKTNQWTVLPNTFENHKKSRFHRWCSGFYDEQLNAHFYFSARDSSAKPGNMWVYRYNNPVPTD